MQPFQATRAATLALALAASSAALVHCGRGPKADGKDAGGPVTTAGIPPEQAARVLAKVGDRTITLGDFAASLEHLDQFDRLRYQSPERRLELLKEMIRVQLLADEAVAKGYDKEPEAAEELRAVLREAVIGELKKSARAPADVPAAEVRAYFDAHRAEYKDPERRRLSLIVAKDEAAGVQIIEAYKKAGLADAGADARAVAWGQLVRDKSLDAQARANVPIDLAGDFGFVSPPGDPRGASARIPEEVRVAGFGIAQVGDVAGAPVTAGGKVYVVKLSTKVDARERTFEEAERTIRVKLAQDELEKKESELLAALRKELDVKIDEAALATVKVDLAPVDAGPAAPTSASAPAPASASASAPVPTPKKP